MYMIDLMITSNTIVRHLSIEKSCNSLDVRFLINQHQHVKNSNEKNTCSTKSEFLRYVISKDELLEPSKR